MARVGTPVAWRSSKTEPVRGDEGQAPEEPMNVEELKKLVKHSTAVLVLDNGEPSFAILSYDTYKDLVLGGKEKEIKIHPVRSLARDKVASSEDLGEATSNGINQYSNNGAPTKPTLPDNELEILERINKDILALKSEIEKEEKMITVD
ncbi:MAG: hypothetical protein HYT64_02660 [Candidatus Yanofskybacteria bacterium]|nr:hypothetical protein [Candidatus Yanofskybacteria bacterium]